MRGEVSGHNHARQEGPGFVARLAITLLLTPLLLVLLKPALMRFVQSRTASYAGVGRFDDAVRVSKKWLMFDGGNPVAWSDIAAYYRSAGQGEEALRAYGKAVELDPENAKTRFEVGMFHAYRNEWAAAVPHFERARQLSQEGVKLLNADRHRSALTMLERGYMKLGDGDKAAVIRAELNARFPAVSR